MREHERRLSLTFDGEHEAVNRCPSQASRTAKGILRSVCGPNPQEQSRTQANSLPEASAFSRLFTRVRCCSRFLRKSGRTVQIGFLEPFSCRLRSVCGLLEIGVLGIDTDDPVIVDSMRARP
jgi:hypothetical protein